MSLSARGLHGAITALGALRLIAAFHREAPLRERGIVIAFEAP